MSLHPLTDDVPDVVPGWMLRPPTCDCCGELRHDTSVEPVVETPWATPGVTGLGSTDPGLPGPSPVVAALLRAVAAVERVDPAALPAGQAAADAQALLQVEQRLRVHDLARIADVSKRGLHDLAGWRSAQAFVRDNRPDGDSGDARFAQLLGDLPVLQAAVLDGRVALLAAQKVAKALRRVSPHLDRPDGLVDGQPADEVISAVIANVVTLVCRDRSGLADDDPALAGLLAEAARLHALDGTDRERIEAAFTWLAGEVGPRALAGPLEELVLAVLPSELEDRDRAGRDRRSLELRPLRDGSGWDVRGTLTLESGERLWTALRAEAARDPEGVADTAAWEQQHAAGLSDDPWASALGVVPRGRRQRLHDALDRLLERYLDAGLGGRTGKALVQVNVTVPESAVTGAAGSLPPRTDSGQLVPRSLVRRWWCDSSVTAFVLGLGGKALRAVHAQRTLTADERRAGHVETGGRCAGSGCCPPTPDLLRPLRPHHVGGFAENQITTLDETVWFCDTSHFDVHHGKVVRLRDGRFLAEDGFRDGPLDPPPF